MLIHTDDEFLGPTPSEMPFEPVTPGAQRGAQLPNDGDGESAEAPTTPYKDYAYYKTNIDHNIGVFADEQTKVRNRRDLRRNTHDIMRMRQNNELLADETFIADNTIDVNVRAEKPAYMQFLETARTLITLSPRVPNPSEIAPQVQRLESWFTQGAKYDRWKQPWYLIIDACILHGYIGFEVEFDITKPLHFAIRYIKRDDLVIPAKCADLEELEVIPRRLQLTPMQLEAWKSAPGFNSAEIDRLLQTRENNRWEKLDIYCILFKHAGVVHKAFYSQAANTWLRDPAPLDIGLIKISDDGTPSPAPVLTYPLVSFLYQATEEEDLLSIEGRAKIDAAAQEAIGRLISATVNGATRASGLYPVRKPHNLDTNGSKQVTLKHGEVADGNIEALQLPWPSNIALQVIQTLSVRNRQSLGQIDFAAMSRQDTAKSATELQLASKQAAQLSSIQIALFSDAVLKAYSLGFEIARSQAIAGQLDPNNMPDAEAASVLTLDFAKVTSGDTEVLRRAEKIQNLKEIMQIVLPTPAGMFFLKMLFQSMFPDDYAKIERELNAIDGQAQQAAVYQELVSALEKLIPQLPPDEQRDLTALINIARQMAPGPGNGAQNSGASEGVSGPTQTGAAESGSGAQ